MTDKPSRDPNTNVPRVRPRYPLATAAQKLTGGIRFDDLIGLLPGDADDGFEEAIRELRELNRSEP